MDCALAKRCLTEKGFIQTQRNMLSNRDLHFIYCASVTVAYLKKTYGPRYHQQYLVALCREGVSTVAFLDGPIINLTRFFNRPSSDTDKVSITRIIELDHCAHGMHVYATENDGASYAFDVTVWVRSAVERLESFFALKREKIPGKVTILQHKRGWLSNRFQYNVTCSLHMIIGLAIDTYEKLPTDKCNWCGKGRSEASSPLPLSLAKCKACLTTRYCGRTCQINDWREGHADECNSYKIWASQGVKLRGEYVTVDTTVYDSTEAIDSVLHQLQAADPERYAGVTFLV